ncbi:NADH:flavin oxidoreductase/NADH oxidase [Streptomyces sp. NBC_00513]|uniref:NADH:flavin oxidoreductase/NADH oxidase n=1 Tax=unclassified Streptomyces TaxID=2593676 RepID=UPI00224FE672|nr:NADH:flavin oxidoreductase/NADH oxidase [Streptomyces sp. NBC_00424]MCX5076794.1 NADH:flavin oxidoreductase/NADH oxidase [Streptomyces sp. NBC_00424]WUD40192.1 NADH:flavin oxidoreductase/NADH oxidase [Streptomyces sp. NBC_00513]
MSAAPAAFAALFQPRTIRSVTIPNRVWMAPMCQYSAEATGPAVGAAGPWHFAHYAARAVGGTGLIIQEATAISPEGRISPYDLGIWNDTQVEALRPITAFLKSQGTISGIQLAHAGRKASTERPWKGGRSVGPEGHGWLPDAPSALPFHEGDPIPHELTVEQIHEVTAQFADAARRSLEAGFEIVEIHGAHGYLIGQFLSPRSNHRTDEYGGSFENRTRFALEVVDAVRAVWPAELPLFFRISATDWLEEDGWTGDDTVRLAALLHEHGVDFLDVSTGGLAPDAEIPVAPGFQVPFAARVKAETSLPVAAVGLITEPAQAEKILSNGEADAILLGRELLRDPYWARRAAAELGAEPRTPSPYHRAW